MSISGYKSFVDVMKNKVILAWNMNQKVQALVEIMTAAAMLEDPGNQVAFYPSIFVVSIMSIKMKL